MIEYAGQFKDCKYNVTQRRNHNKNGKDLSRCEDIFTLDLETTSFFIDKNYKILMYDKSMTDKEIDSYVKMSLVYIVQFSINDTVYYVRTLDDFKKALDDLPKDIDIIIWVHNLSFEFMFLRNIILFDEVFAIRKRKPIYAKSNCNYPNITFRCSYMLTRLSLDKWAKKINNGVLKMVGDLDYNVFRTPYTQLSDRELGYCKNDCLVVYYGIGQYADRYASLHNIPLTQTGCIRRVIKSLLMGDTSYRKQIKKLIPSDADEYSHLMDTFAGGWTHANRKWAGLVIDDSVYRYRVGHNDFASSYPYTMCAERLPMSKFVYLGEQSDIEIQSHDYDKYAYMYLIEIKDVRCIKYNTYIQAYKCKELIRDATDEIKPLDNGRVINADKVVMWCTEQDLITIRQMYKFSQLKSLITYRAVKGYLPKKFILYILKLFGDKTTLDGVDGMETIYAKSKEEINALFGMCVTAILQGLVEFDTLDELNKNWRITAPDANVVNDYLDKLRQPKDTRYFLSYAWGVWITAYSRRHLMSIINHGDNDRAVIYGDTDSLFFIDDIDYKWYNLEVDKKMLEMCKYYNIDINLTRPKKPSGKIKALGHFEPEPDCVEFVTLGAKRYCERRKKDGKLYMTVSGVNKDAVELLNDNIYNFTDGFIFDRDADCVTMRLVTYINSMPDIVCPDGYIHRDNFGIHLMPKSYNLSVDDEYKKVSKWLNFMLDDITESGENVLKSWFETEEYI